MAMDNREMWLANGQTEREAAAIRGEIARLRKAAVGACAPRHDAEERLQIHGMLRALEWVMEHTFGEER